MYTNLGGMVYICYLKYVVDEYLANTKKEVNSGP
jgi:hypothetical protein